MNRLFALIGFSYLIMLAACVFVPQSTLTYLLAAMAIGFITTIFIKKTRQEKIFPVVLLTFMFATVTYIINFNVNIKPVDKYNGKDIVITGEICDLPYKQNNKYYYILNIQNINGKDVRKFRIRMSSPKAIESDVCDKFTGNVHIFLPENSAGFNSKIFYRSKNIYAHAFLYDHMGYSSQTPERKPLYAYALKLREKMLESSKIIFPQRIAALLNGILLNERHELPKDIKHNFSAIGVYHLLATAGMHVAILSQFFLSLFKKFRLNQRIAAVLAAISVFMFMAVTCFTPSITRAGVMSIIYLLGLAFFKKSDSVNSLGIAVLLMCLFSPNAALDISLWLSFISTLGAILSSRKIELWLKNKLKLEHCKNRFLNYIFSITAMTISVVSFSLPLAAWFFKKTSLLAVFSNVLLVFPASILLNSGISTQVMYLLNLPEFIYIPIAAICGLCANFILFCSEKLAAVPFAQISLDYGFISLWLAFTVMLIAVFVFFGIIKKKLKLTLIFSLNILLVGVFSYEIYIKDVTRIAILNCGSSLCLTFHKNNHTAMIFCGNEKIYTDSISDALEEIYPQRLDFFQVLSMETSESEDFVTEITKTYSPEVLILPLENNLILENLPRNTIFFKNNIKSDFWGNVNVQTQKINDKIYLFIKILNTPVLVCANGGNAQDLPKEWLECDYLIASGLPINFETIKTKQIFLSMDQEFSKLILKKLPSLISTAYAGTVYIDVNNSEGTIIRRRK